MKPETGSGGLTDAERVDLRGLAEREGADALARRLGVHREALARAAAGFGTRRGTIALIRAGMSLRALSSPASSSAPPPSAA